MILVVGSVALSLLAWLTLAMVGSDPAPGARTSVRADPTKKRVNLAAASGPASTPAPGTIDDPPPTFQFQTLSPQEAYKVNEGIPTSPLPNPAAKAFVFPPGRQEDKARAIQCLAQAVYYEAGSETMQGQQAVAQVVLNRVRNPVYPNTVCATVFQGSDRSTGCQFTFTCDGSMSRPPSAAGWTRAQVVASRALDGFVEKSVGNATHYHTVWVVPYWSPTLLKVARIGAHIFYRWVGTAGLPVSFTDPYGGAEPKSPTSPLPLVGSFVDPGAAAETSRPVAIFAAPTVTAQTLRPITPENLDAPVTRAPSPALTAPEATRLQPPEQPRTGPSRLPVPHGW